MKKLFFNGNIYTMDETIPRADAIITDENKFMFVGKEEDARMLLEDKVFNECDLKGQFVIPAFNDTHIHLLLYALSCERVDLIGCDSINEIKKRMKSWLCEKGTDKDGWLHGEGWLNERFIDDTRYPNRYDLDEISKDIPIMITRACLHSAVLNSKGLEYLGLNKNSVKKYGKQLGIDINGEPNGIIKEKLMFNTTAKFSFSEENSIISSLKSVIPQLHEQGIVSVNSDNVRHMKNYDYKTYFEAIQKMEKNGDLKLRIAEQVTLSDSFSTLPTKLNNFFSEGYGRDWGTDKFKISHIKLVVDGNLGNKTAAMRKSYLNDPTNHGILNLNKEEFNELVLLVHKHGCPFAAHAIGDMAIEICLDAIDNACVHTGDNNIRHGIIHCQITDDELLEKIIKTNMLALIQPIHMDYDMTVVRDFVGEELAETSYAWKKLDDNGVRVSLGTDCPVESFNTMRNLYLIVTRKNITGDEKQVYRPEQKMLMERALRAYTLEGAYVSGEENIKGSITNGKLADFIVLDHDLINLENEQQILGTKVLITIFDGEIVFDRYGCLSNGN